MQKRKRNDVRRATLPGVVVRSSFIVGGTYEDPDGFPITNRIREIGPRGGVLKRFRAIERREATS